MPWLSSPKGAVLTPALPSSWAGVRSPRLLCIGSNMTEWLLSVLADEPVRALEPVRVDLLPLPAAERGAMKTPMLAAPPLLSPREARLRRLPEEGPIRESRLERVSVADPANRKWSILTEYSCSWDHSWD